MNKKRLILVICLLAFLGFGFLFFKDHSEDYTIEEYQEIPQDNYQKTKQILNQFLGFPYQRGPLDEGNNIYREDVFDCTTLVLVTASKLNNPQNPEEMIKRINYYPAGEVSYQNRLHFSSYRNKVSEYFKDITALVGEDYIKSKKVTLNNGQNGKLIDIDWEKTITLDYILKEDVSKVINNLPEVAGVMFMREQFADIGLDVGHEGFVLDGQNLIHASSAHQKVVEENFLSYLQNSNYDGVIFYKLN